MVLAGTAQARKRAPSSAVNTATATRVDWEMEVRTNIFSMGLRRDWTELAHRLLVFVCVVLLKSKMRICLPVQCEM